MSSLRIQKFIAEHFDISRRKAEQLLLDKKIVLNGKIVETLGTTIDPDKDQISILESSIKKIDNKKIYVLLHKPKEVLCSREDPHYIKSETIYSLLPKNLQYLDPVGRLDKNSTGLLLLTNDGEVNYKISHPKFSCKKEYVVETNGHPHAKNLKKLQEGITIEGIKYSPCGIKRILKKKNTEVFSVVLREGKKRQIRVLFEYIGNPVIGLKRIRIGKLRLGIVEEGKWRFLKKEEIYGIMNNVKSQK